MPVWHEQTKDLLEEGAIQTVGLIQEQHPDRCRLFMQWKQMDWPVLVDPINKLGIGVVPLTLLIDEHGVVRKIGARPNDLEWFLNAEFEAPDPGESRDEAKTQAADSGRRDSMEEARSEDLLATGDGLVLWGDDAALSEAIQHYEAALAAGAPKGPTHFRLGVAHRIRDESDDRREGDFAKAVEHWESALDTNPNQYIWRRRIQQYGPRLDKPYPFYDWVERARREIRERGETPHPLALEPRGAELTRPARQFDAADATREEPDPQGRISRDHEGFVEVEDVVVATTRPNRGGVARVHLTFRPNEDLKAHWNNEVAPLEVWLDPPAGWKIDGRSRRAPMPADQAVSTEPRTVEFELQHPKGASGRVVVSGYALYYVCEDVDGVCLYRRRDLEIPVEVKPSG